jgi:hypothetical protein
MRLLILSALACRMAGAADVCPLGKSFEAGGAPGTVMWLSYRAEPRPGKFCVGNEVRNQSPAPVEVAWPEAGLERAALQGQLQVAECCFDGVATTKAALQFGDKAIEVTMHHPAEEGLAGHQEGYPDLIEEDARVRTVSLRGTLSAEGRQIAVDLTLKCSASRFARQYAYQYGITDRSADAIGIEWDLLERMRANSVPSVQPTPGGKTYLFLSDTMPKEAKGRILLRTRAGTVAAIFRFDGFAADPR